MRVYVITFAVVSEEKSNSFIATKKLGKVFAKMPWFCVFI
jgi:hypothetical protein